MHRQRLDRTMASRSKAFIWCVNDCRAAAVRRGHDGLFGGSLSLMAAVVVRRMAFATGPIICCSSLSGVAGAVAEDIDVGALAATPSVEEWELGVIVIVVRSWSKHPDVKAAEEVGRADDEWNELSGGVDAVHAADAVPGDNKLDGHDEDGCDENIRNCTELLQ